MDEFRVTCRAHFSQFRPPFAVVSVRKYVDFHPATIVDPFPHANLVLPSSPFLIVLLSPPVLFFAVFSIVFSRSFLLLLSEYNMPSFLYVTGGLLKRGYIYIRLHSINDVMSTGGGPFRGLAGVGLFALRPLNLPTGLSIAIRALLSISSLTAI